MGKVRNLKYNNVTVEQPVYQGVNLTKWIHDGVIVWENGEIDLRFPNSYMLMAGTHLIFIDMDYKQVAVAYLITNSSWTNAKLNYYNTAAGNYCQMHTSDSFIVYLREQNTAAIASGLDYSSTEPFDNTPWNSSGKISGVDIVSGGDINGVASSKDVVARDDYFIVGAFGDGYSLNQRNGLGARLDAYGGYGYAYMDEDETWTGSRSYPKHICHAVGNEMFMIAKVNGIYNAGRFGYIKSYISYSEYATDVTFVCGCTFTNSSGVEYIDVILKINEEYDDSTAIRYQFLSTPTSRIEWEKATDITEIVNEWGVDNILEMYYNANTKKMYYSTASSLTSKGLYYTSETTTLTSVPTQPSTQNFLVPTYVAQWDEQEGIFVIGYSKSGTVSVGSNATGSSTYDFSVQDIMESARCQTSTRFIDSKRTKASDNWLVMEKPVVDTTEQSGYANILFLDVSAGFVQAGVKKSFCIRIEWDEPYYSKVVAPLNIPSSTDIST